MKHTSSLAVTAPDPFDEGRIRWAIGKGYQRCRNTTVHARQILRRFLQLSTFNHDSSTLAELAGVTIPPARSF